MDYFLRRLFLALIILAGILTSCTALFALILLGVDKVYAQAADIATVYEVADKEAVDGDLLSQTPGKGIVRSTIPLDHRLFGILQEQPLMAYKRIDNAGTPIARNGTAQVNVTTLNGPIKAGDYITSSQIAGKGAKATTSGYVIGIALTPLDDKVANKKSITLEGGKAAQVAEGKITVVLRIEYAEIDTTRDLGRLFKGINIALFSSLSDPSQASEIFRYLMAGMVVLIGFGVGFYTFSRSVPKGIEAIGRNPLAQKAISFSIAMNIVFTILTASVGVIAAAFILRL